jgi:sugar porter (SP) family MFS transporter
MSKVMRWSAGVAIGGFLFGFDTAVISGADQPLQRLWHTSDLFHGLFVMSSALWGTVLGALTGSAPCEWLGRKRTLALVGLLYLVSALGSALAIGPYSFAVLRFLGGVGVGISSIVVPAYISEIAPPVLRGRLGALYQFQIVFGILIALLSNFLLSEFAGLDWRWMVGIEAVPAFGFLWIVCRVPESPRWLLAQAGKELECRRILAITDPGRVNETLEEIRRSSAEQAGERLFAPQFRFLVFLAFSIAVFNQLSGINFIIYFAPRVFALAGLHSSTALLSTVGVGLVNLVMTLVGMWLIDKAGRRALLGIGSVGYIVSLSAVAWAFYMNAGGIVVVGFVFLFIASHAVGQGAVIWVFLSEIFPNTVRTKGQSLGSGTHWVAAALIALVMPYLLGQVEAYAIFGFFAIAMVFQGLFVVFIMPETKGRSLESLAGELVT